MMYVATLPCLIYSGQESQKQFALYHSDKPVTLKQGQGNQTKFQLNRIRLQNFQVNLFDTAVTLKYGPGH